MVAPGLAREVTAAIAADLTGDLRQSHPSVDWRTELSVDRLVAPPAPVTELFDAARRRLLEGDWDLALVITDLPLRLAGRPLSRYVSRTYGIAVVSLPALGALHLGPRLRRTLVRLVDDLVGSHGHDHLEETRRARRRGRWRRGVLRELASQTAAPSGAWKFLVVPTVVLGHLRLLLGMVRANRPWRFAARLYGALVAAFAVGGYGIIASDVWRISTAMGWARLTILCVTSIVGMAVAVVVVHGLWERAPDPRVRDQVVLFNVATVATVALGILSLYLALFVGILASVSLVITTDVLANALGHSVRRRDYVELAWFIASFAAIGGALGAALESDEAIREAAYAASAGDDEP